MGRKRFSGAAVGDHDERRSDLDGHKRSHHSLRFGRGRKWSDSMRIMKLFVAAAIAFGTMSVAAAPASAQGGHTGQYRHDGQRHDAGRDDNRRHRGWHNNRGHHRGWRTRRVCRTIWRNHQRQRVCRTVRYRR